MPPQQDATGTSEHGPRGPRPPRKTRPPAATFLPGLTPLRGIAALWVVLYHYTKVFPALDAEHASRLIGGGYLAVDLFFLLSGFVTTHRLVDQRGVHGVSACCRRSWCCSVGSPPPPRPPWSVSRSRRSGGSPT